MARAIPMLISNCLVLRKPQRPGTGRLHSSRPIFSAKRSPTIQNCWTSLRFSWSTCQISRQSHEVNQQSWGMLFLSVFDDCGRADECCAPAASIAEGRHAAIVAAADSQPFLWRHVDLCEKSRDSRGDRH